MISVKSGLPGPVSDTSQTHANQVTGRKISKTGPSAPSAPLSRAISET